MTSLVIVMTSLAGAQIAHVHTRARQAPRPNTVHSTCERDILSPRASKSRLARCNAGVTLVPTMRGLLTLMAIVLCIKILKILIVEGNLVNDVIVEGLVTS